MQMPREHLRGAPIIVIYRFGEAYRPKQLTGSSWASKFGG